MPLAIIPQPGNTLGQTRDPIANNFSLIENAFVTDHVDYGLANQGKHNQITFPIHTGTIPSNGVPVASEIYLFNQNAAPTNTSDIWLQRGSGTPFPMTGSSKTTLGWTYLPSGILLKWGNVTLGSAVTNFAIVAAQGPAYSTLAGSVYTVQLTNGLPGNNGALVFINSFGGAGQGNTFTVNSIGAGGLSFQYLMIGNT